MKSSKRVFAALFLFALAPLAMAQGTYTQIAVPGALDTYPGAIDSAGDVVGSYTDDQYNFHGFLLSNGTYTTINVPGGEDYTIATGINDNGKIVGFSRPTLLGFEYDVQTATFTTLSDPNGTITEPCCINNNGVIGGAYYNTGGPYGFALVDSTYRTLTPPETTTSSVIGVTASGEFILSSVTSANKAVYYSYSDGSYSKISFPGNIDNGLIFGVNPQGTEFVGAYSPNIETAAGFVYQNGVLTTLQFPGSTDTNAEGVNRFGEVVGIYTDASGYQQGFSWKASSAEEKK